MCDRYSRHPSYCGFFYWAVLTQALLGNVASTIAFVFILGNFFVNRIKGKLSSRNTVTRSLLTVADEEKFLVRFFGNDYIEYRKKVGTGLPFPIPA
jgi:protein-S-isoprenylcysteine O-methyltransferase